MPAGWKPKSGERLYAIGDIHGRADLFDRLLSQIRADDAVRPTARTRIVVLGDIIDRGPQAADLTQRMMRYTQASDRFIVLKGNHEQIMVAALGGDYTALESWLRFGGDATLASWGVPQTLIEEGASPALMRMARKLIPPGAIRWLDRLTLSYRSGDVVFIHAGLRPGVPLRDQNPVDLMWIGDEFLNSDERRDFLVVHGHSIREDGPDVRSNRIGIDTGAYRTGRLTALGLEADETWVLST